MNKILITCAILVCVLGSCKKTETPVYERKNGVYFQLFTTHFDKDKDTISFSFVRYAEQVTTAKVDVRVNLQGIPMDHDRKFIMAVDKERSTAVEGVDFEPLEPFYTIAAGEYYTLVPVTLIRTPKQKDEQIMITFTLQETEDLEQGLRERQHAVIKYTDRLMKPIYWDTYVGTWGEWSQVKQLTAERVLGWEFPQTREEFTSQPFNAIMYAGANYMNNWFKENVVYDENNNRIMPWK